MILQDIIIFLKHKLPNIYTEHQQEINVDQFGVLELDLINIDENCEQWMATVFLYSKKSMMKHHHEKLNEIIDYCKFNGSVKVSGKVINFYQPQINKVGNTQLHYVHSLAIPVNYYESEEI